MEYQPSDEGIAYAKHFIPVAERRYPPTHTVYTIAASAEIAELIARLTVENKLPPIYLFACDCLRAWREQPSYCASRYFPYQVEVWDGPGALLGLASKRLDGERS